MKKWIKKFPIFIYGVIACGMLLVYHSIYGINDFDTAPYKGAEIRIWLLIVIMFVPIGFIYSQIVPVIASFGLTKVLSLFSEILVVIVVCFLLDLLLLYLRFHLIPAIRTKNKNLLVPGFFKRFFPENE